MSSHRHWMVRTARTFPSSCFSHGTHLSQIRDSLGTGWRCACDRVVCGIADRQCPQLAHCGRRSAPNPERPKQYTLLMSVCEELEIALDDQNGREAVVCTQGA